jgi:LuxR family maltose regulon positive regulatory protein
VNRLIDAGDVPVAMLLAPAGYGKTTLLSDWEAVDPRPFAWVDLDESDNDAGTLLSAIALALEGIEAVGWDVLEPLPSPARDGTTASLRRLLRKLRERDLPLVLVLDDVQVIRSQGSRAILAAIAQACGQGLQLALASRSDEGIPVARLRAHGKAVVLRGSQLAMTRAEAAALLSQAGLRLSPEQVLELHRRTEGWPAGLLLAALSLAEGAELKDFGGGDRLIRAYVRDEFLSSLTEEDRDFLTATSVLDRLTGPVCNALLDSDDAADRLARLSQANAMLVPLDRRNTAYRYNELFVTALRAELQRSDPTRESDLHRRASGWYASEGDTERAIGHALAAGDVDRAATGLWESALPRIARGDGVGEWLERFGADRLHGHPLLALVAAASALAGGDFYEAERWVTLARSMPGDDSARGGTLLMRAALGRHGASALAADAKAAAALLDPESPWQALCLMLRGVARSLTDDSPQARELLKEAAHLSAARAPLVQTLCLAQAALLEAGNDPTRASMLAERARAQVGRCALGDRPLVALVYAASAQTRVQAGRTSEASADLREAERLLRASTEPSAWLEAECCIALARAELRLSGPAAARKLLERAGRAAGPIADAPVLLEWLANARAEIEVALDSTRGGDWSLTTAELRILNHLPSHLSFREIAVQLYVSPNTVKTHARGIYRKLGVSSRGEAVELARGAGLVHAATGA